MDPASPRRPFPVVVLLGAGASMDAGLPSAVELQKRLVLRLQQDNEIDLKRALGLIVGGIAFQRGVEGFLESSSVDIETVLRVAQLLENRSTHPLAGYVAVWNSSLDKVSPGGDGSVFHRLNQFARDALNEWLRTPDDPIMVKYLAQIFQLRRPWARRSDNVCMPQIFTLNYDLCLEKALHYESLPFTTGFSNGLWTPKEFDRNDIVRVYKLHGSFGWVRDPRTLLLYDRDAALGRTDVEFFSGETSDELIFGVDNKLQAMQPFLWLAHQFYEAVSAATYIVAIGYRFADDYVNQIIGQAMASDASKRLLVVSPRFDTAVLEHARGMNYYPERTIPIQCTAKIALQDQDMIRSKLQELEEIRPAETPFS